MEDLKFSNGAVITPNGARHIWAINSIVKNESREANAWGFRIAIGPASGIMLDQSVYDNSVLCLYIEGTEEQVRAEHQKLIEYRETVMRETRELINEVREIMQR